MLWPGEALPCPGSLGLTLTAGLTVASMQKGWLKQETARSTAKTTALAVHGVRKRKIMLERWMTRICIGYHL